MTSTSGESEPTWPLQMSVESRDKTAILAAAGEIDMLTAHELEEAVQQVLEESPRTLLLDLTEVTFLSSAGLSALVRSHKQAGDETDLRVIAAGTAVLRPLQLMGLDNVLAIYATRDEATTTPDH